MNYLGELLIFVSLIAWGVILEDLILKEYFKRANKKFRTHHFSFSRYVYLLIFPLVAWILLIFRVGIQLFYIFFAFAFLGTLIEWLIGYFYHHIVGQRLWTYHRLSLGGYTSLLSIPLWGLAGALFWLLSRVFI